MNAGGLASLLAAYSRMLRKSGAAASSALVTELADALGKRENATLVQIAKAATAPDACANNGSASGRDLLPLIQELRGFCALLVKKGPTGDLDKLIEILRTVGNAQVSVLGVEPVASRSKRGAAKGATPMNHELIEDYLRRLKSALGDDRAFMAIYHELEDKRRVTAPDLAAIADRFMGPVSSKATRPKALQAILSRHRKLLDFVAGSASIGSRAA